ncbi:MAG: Gfo/Idh/MocA family protein [Halobacteriaceae archaeon]
MTLDAAVVGAGHMGRRHAEVLDELAGVTVTAVADVDGAAAAALAADVGATRRADCREAVAEADLVFVTTPPRERVEPVRAAAEAGAAVFCEKPLAGTLADGRELVETVERTGVPFAVGFCQRFREPFRRVRDLVAGGDLGVPLQQFHVRGGEGIPEGENWRTDPEQATGIAVESLSHELDLARWLGGEVAAVRGETLGTLPDLPAFDDNVSATLRFESGAIGTLQVSWTASVPYTARGVVGTEGSVVVESEDIWDVRRLRVNTGDGVETVEFDDDAATDMGYAAEDRAFVDAVRAGETPPVTVHDGMAALELSHELRDSATGSLHGWREGGDGGE